MDFMNYLDYKMIMLALCNKTEHYVIVCVVTKNAVPKYQRTETLRYIALGSDIN